MNKVDLYGLIIKVVGGNHAQVLSDLEKIFYGTFEIKEDGTVLRATCPVHPDENFDMRLQVVLDSEKTYLLYTDSKLFSEHGYGIGREPGVYNPRGRAMYYDPKISYDYSQDFGLLQRLTGDPDEGNGATALGHEIMRAFAHDIGEPQTDTAQSRANVVYRANPGYVRQGLRPRTHYTNRL